MPSIGDLLIPIGPIGPTGATGSRGTDMPEPGANVSGRLNAGWNRVLPLSGGSANQLSGGLRFPNVIASAGNDVTQHLMLWGTTYGFCITGSTLNCVADQRHQFYTSNYGYEGEVRYRAFWFSTNGWRWEFNTSTGGILFLDSSGNAKFGWYWDSGNGWRVVGWETCWMYSGNDCVIQVNGGGVWYYNVNGVDRFNFNWDGTLYGRVNNAVQIGFANACDAGLKQDIAPSTFDCLAAIRKIRFYQYRWKDYVDTRYPPKPAPIDAPTIPIGFIAQRLYEDFPEAVARKEKLVDVGAQSMWSGDTNTIMATLVGAIQQLDKEVTAMAGS